MVELLLSLSLIYVRIRQTSSILPLYDFSKEQKADDLPTMSYVRAIDIPYS